MGDVIEHKLVPGFRMTVEDVRSCETDLTRRDQHDQYLITDPEGNKDWLCAYDVREIPDGT